MLTFTPSRLATARRRRGLTKRALAERAGISARSLTDYEKGTQNPGPLTLLRVAEALEFPVEFLTGPDLDEPALDAVSFRALSRLTARQRDQGIGSATLALSLSDWIGARFVLPEPDIPRHYGIDAETAAGAVRNAWGLGERSIRNMVHLLEARGVRVFSLAEECRELDAFSFWRGRIPYVFLNTQKSAERSRMDAAHELGHLVLHSHHELPAGRRAEHEAQMFAGAFLMPRGSVLAEAPRGARLDQLVNAKSQWNVSVASLAFRMHALGLLSDWQYRTAFAQISKKGYRRDEPAGSPGECSQVLAKILTELRREGVSTTDIARELAISVSDLSALIFGLVPTPVGDENLAPPVPASGARAELRIV